jgi:putative phosphoesterase
MILGLLSDTHGHLERTLQALTLLQEADHLFHCGDIGSEAILTLLLEEREKGRPVTAVPGNVDEWDPDFMLLARKLDFPLPHHLRLETDGLRIAVHHGHDKNLLDHLAADPELDLLFTGHTHVPMDDRDGPVRIINPGAVYRASQPGVATLDTRTGQLTRLLL